MIASTSQDVDARRNITGDDDEVLGLVNVAKSPALKQLQEASQSAIHGIKGTLESLLEKAAEADSLKDQLAEALEENERLRSREEELLQKLEEERGRGAELEEEAKDREAAMGEMKKLVQMVKSFQRGTRNILLQEWPKGKGLGKRKKAPNNNDNDDNNGKREKVHFVAADDAGEARVADTPSPDLFRPRRRRKQNGDDKGEGSGGSCQLALPGGSGADLEVPRGSGADVAPGGAGAELAVPNADVAGASGCAGGEGEIVTEFEEGFRGSDYTKEEAVKLIIEKVPNRKTRDIEYRGNKNNPHATIRARLTWFETPSDIIHHVEYNNDFYTLSGWLTEIKDRSKKWKEHVYIASDNDPDGGANTLLSSIHPFSGTKLANALWKKKTVLSSA